MSTYREEVREEMKTRCIHLRTKAAFFPLPAPNDERKPYAAAIWWCGRTCESLGPDGSAAHQGDCERAGRRCYEGPSSS